MSPLRSHERIYFSISLIGKELFASQAFLVNICIAVYNFCMTRTLRCSNMTLDV